MRNRQWIRVHLCVCASPGVHERARVAALCSVPGFAGLGYVRDPAPSQARHQGRGHQPARAPGSPASTLGWWVPVGLGWRSWESGVPSGQRCGPSLWA